MVAKAGATGSMRRIAGQLGISYETLRKWVRQAEIDGGLSAGTTTEQLEELRPCARKTRSSAGPGPPQVRVLACRPSSTARLPWPRWPCVGVDSACQRAADARVGLEPFIAARR